MGEFPLQLFYNLSTFQFSRNVAEFFNLQKKVWSEKSGRRPIDESLNQRSKSFLLFLKSFQSKVESKTSQEDLNFYKKNLFLGMTPLL